MVGLRRSRRAHCSGDHPDQQLGIVGVAGRQHLDLRWATVPDQRQLGHYRGMKLRRLRGQRIKVLAGFGQQPSHLGVAPRRDHQPLNRLHRSRTDQFRPSRRRGVSPAQAAQQHVERGAQHE
jgi:hypothetical protein